MSSAEHYLALGARDLRAELEELYAAYTGCLDEERFEEWPDFFVDDCIYKIIPRENFERAHAAATKLQSRLTARTGIAGRLLRRRDDETTWMEVYEGVSDGRALETTLAELVRELGLEALLVPGTTRKNEIFRGF